MNLHVKNLDVNIFKYTLTLTYLNLKLVLYKKKLKVIVYVLCSLLCILYFFSFY